MKRGSVWYADLDPTRGHEQAGRRPCVIVSADRLNEGRSGLVTILPITSKPRRELASRVYVPRLDGGLTLDSWIITEQVRTISKTRLGHQLGELTEQQMADVDDALRMLLALD